MSASDVWLLVLARDPSGAKRRLAPALDDRARAELAVAMLADVLDAAGDVDFARRVLVTESDALGTVARDAGIETLAVPLADTNVAAAAGFAAATAAGARSALVLAADLPLLRAADLEAMLAAASGADVVIAPDRHARGTNALLLAPPSRIAPAFGPDSLRVHRARADAAGARHALVRTAGLSTDLDDPDDLALITRSSALGARTAAALTFSPLTKGATR